MRGQNGRAGRVDGVRLREHWSLPGARTAGCSVMMSPARVGRLNDVFGEHSIACAEKTGECDALGTCYSQCVFAASCDEILACGNELVMNALCECSAACV